MFALDDGHDRDARGRNDNQPRQNFITASPASGWGSCGEESERLADIRRPEDQPRRDEHRHNKADQGDGLRTMQRVSRARRDRLEGRRSDQAEAAE